MSHVGLYFETFSLTPGHQLAAGHNIDRCGL